MKWLPTWLAKPYATLYREKRENWLDFNEAKTILNIDNKSALSLRLKRLEESGFLISKRDSVDRRKKFFKLVEPEDTVFALSIQPSRSSDALDLVAAASIHLDYVIGGSYASYVHSEYASPGKIDLYVKKEDKWRWVALLSNKFIAVSVDDMLAEKPARQNVHIHSSLTQEMVEDSIEVNGIRYTRPETLIIDGLREQTEFSITDALAILVKKRKDIDFNKLLKLAKHESIWRELGVCLEIINLEAGKKIFENEIIHEMHSTADLSRKRFFPRDRTEETMDYKQISDKWKLGITLPRAFVTKLVTDIVPMR